MTRLTLIAALALGGSTLAVPAWEWTPQKSGVSARLRGVSAVSESVAWASGSGSTILRTEDGGATWTRLPEPTPDRLDYRDIDAMNATTAYALSIGNGAASRIFKTTDAGQTWAEQYRASEEKIFLDAMTFSDANRGIVLGDSIDGRFFFMTTDNGGARWIPVPVDRLPAALPNEGFFAASGTNVAALGDHIWIGTGAAAKARVLRSADRGLSWAIAETPVAAGPSAGIYSIAFRDAQHGIVVGGDYAKEAEATDNCAITSDGGATWTLIKGLSGFRSVVAPVPGAPATWIAIGPRGSDVSTDDGRTWTPIEGPGFDTFSFVRGTAIGWGSGARGAIAKLRTLN
ncbi:MAG TPA: hypothetical protein VFV98_13285 [Vicinamibacterales bacterium]|nr:hypothetical protein [Vicinamibacterales bacterium]